MSWFRKVDIRTWGDKKFRGLSRDAKLVWIHLLTGLQTTSLPGIQEAGEMATAERLGFSIDEFRAAFGEIEKIGFAKADFDACVIYLPNAISYNLPQSPNVIKGWASLLDLIPECELKAEWIQHTTEALGSFPDTFQKEIKKLSEAYLDPLERISKSFKEENAKASRSISSSSSSSSRIKKKQPPHAGHIESEIQTRLERYPDHQILIERTFDAIASTRKSAKIADSVRLGILASWEPHPVEAVAEGCMTYLDEGCAGEGKRERYLLGIIRQRAGRGGAKRKQMERTHPVYGKLRPGQG